VATGYGLCNNLGCFDVYTDFKIFKVKVPVNFLGTVGFSPRKKGRYFLSV
jgi:hypothetical protein